MSPNHECDQGGQTLGVEKLGPDNENPKNGSHHCSTSNFTPINVTILRPCPASSLCLQIKKVFGIRSCVRIRSLAAKFLQNVQVACNFSEEEN